LGFGDGNNLGARAARGDYLAFLNPDTVVEPGWLEELIAALERQPDAGLATPKILLMADPARINTCGNDVHISGLTLCRGLGLPREALQNVEPVNAISGAAFVMRRQVFDDLGGFDGLFFLYLEDTDLSWRAQLAGYRSIYVPTSVVRHDYALRFGVRKTFYQERNRYLMLLKSLRWRSLLILAPTLLAAEVVTWGFVLLRERGRRGNKLEAYAWVMRHWDEIMLRRDRTQRQRRIADHELLAACAYRLDYGQVGEGLATQLARSVWDPLFHVLRATALALIRW
jgi:hypothetical protein